MDFGSYPPEINSGRMYAGPGAAPMLTAAEAWQGLAAELHSAAGSYQSVVSGLTAGTWVGPSSSTMAAAAASYVTWLNATAAQAEETAAQAKAAAAAYQTAFTSTVPPPMVAANRSQLMTLVATNLFGRNTQAIAANEAQYGEMWAQDAAAMYGYAASSASATSLTPFTPPQQNTNPGGSGAQAAAASQAAGTSAGNVQSTVSSIQQAFSAVPNALTSAATSAQSTPWTAGPISDLVSIFLDLPADLATHFRLRHAAGHAGDRVPSVRHWRLHAPVSTPMTSSVVGQAMSPGRRPNRRRYEPFPATLLNLPPGTHPAPERRGRPRRGQLGRSIVRSADLGRRYTGGKAHVVHAAGAAGNRGQRHRRAGGRSRFGKHAQPDGFGGHGRTGDGRDGRHRRQQAPQGG